MRDKQLVTRDLCRDGVSRPEHERDLDAADEHDVDVPVDTRLEVERHAPAGARLDPPDRRLA